MATVSEMSSTIAVGSAKAQGLKAKPTESGDRSELPRVTRARDEATQMVASSWRIQRPIEETRHTQASYLSPDREVFFMPLRVD
jgi:hypothetical protein